MPKSFSENIPTVWHYTTASGLHGILQSDSLNATNILYLNDGQELVGFFYRRMRNLVAEVYKAQPAAALIGKATADALRGITLKLPIYVTSFCAPINSKSDNGLLSQWRGYGHDGGYAIVFDSKQLTVLLEEEIQQFRYAHVHVGDVDYETDPTASPKHEETIQWELAIREALEKKMKEPDYQVAADIFDPLISLATRHKHGGFGEENEARVVAVPDRDKNPKSNLPTKPVQFRNRDGVLVPFIKFFDWKSEKPKLPVNKIVVGPHPDREKRARSVEMLVEQVGLEARVVVSEIPYLGR